jgi:protein-arginine kinase activator protein McsA
LEATHSSSFDTAYTSRELATLCASDCSMATDKKSSKRPATTLSTECEVAAADKKVRQQRPEAIYLVCHSYTSSHNYTDQVATDNIGAYYSKRNAVLAAVDFIEKEFDVKFTDRDTWESTKGTAIDNSIENEGNTIRDLYDRGEFETTVETEGEDDHTVEIKCVTMDDA